jgi:hypothetical protein
MNTIEYIWEIGTYYLFLLSLVILPLIWLSCAIILKSKKYSHLLDVSHKFDNVFEYGAIPLFVTMAVVFCWPILIIICIIGFIVNNCARLLDSVSIEKK